MNKIINWDTIFDNKIHFLKNIIDSKEYFKNKKQLPYGAHWIFFNENYTNEELGLDGHPKRGNFFPLLKGYKRMFAGSSIAFKKNIYLNDKIKKITKIDSYKKKKSNQNNLYFYNLLNVYFREEIEVLREMQTIVFVKNQNSKKKNIKKYFLENLSLIYKKKIKFNNIDLFRYSALTYNSHRIHYDLDYAIKNENHKSLLVHGPLIATKALHELCKFKKVRVKKYNFSIVKPIFVNEKVTIKTYLSRSNLSNFFIKIFKKDNELAFDAIVTI